MRGRASRSRIFFAKETSSVAGTFIFYQVQKFCSSQKLQRTEGCYLASIWKCIGQHYIGESMEMFNIQRHDIAISIDSLWNAEQDISKSMPGSNLQLVVTFDSSKIFELGKK